MIGPPEPGAAAGSRGELALEVLRVQLEAVRSHAAGTRAGSDPEELHDMRVGTRRLRAALRAFADVLPDAAEAVRDEFKWLGGTLAAVRDLDVQIEQLRDWRTSIAEIDQVAMDNLLSILSEERARAQQVLMKALDSKRYARLLTRATHLLQADLPAAAAEPITSSAFILIRESFRELRKRGDVIDSHSTAAELHAVRIRAKRLRYLVEFLSIAYGAPAERFVQRVTHLQDVLGTHQDAQVAIDRLRERLAARGAEMNPGIAFLMGEIAQRYAATAQDMRAQFGKAYRRVTGKRWRRLRKALRPAQA